MLVTTPQPFDLDTFFENLLFRYFFKWRTRQSKDVARVLPNFAYHDHCCSNKASCRQGKSLQLLLSCDFLLFIFTRSSHSLVFLPSMHLLL